MDWGDILVAFIAAVPGVIALVVALKKIPHENAKTDADTEKVKAEIENIHAEIADRWAEQVKRLDFQILDLLERDKKKAERIGVLESQVLKLTNEKEVLRLEVDALARGVMILSRQLVDLGHQPKWKKEE